MKPFLCICGGVLLAFAAAGLAPLWGPGNAARTAQRAIPTNKSFTFAVHNVDGLSYSNAPYGLDTQHPTNIEVSFGQEPVVSRDGAGWKVRFK